MRCAIKHQCLRVLAMSRQTYQPGGDRINPSLTLPNTNEIQNARFNLPRIYHYIRLSNWLHIKYVYRSFSNKEQNSVFNYLTPNMYVDQVLVQWVYTVQTVEHVIQKKRLLNMYITVYALIARMMTVTTALLKMLILFGGCVKGQW